MPAITTPEIYGIGAVAIALTSGFGVILWKIWGSHVKLFTDVMKVVEKNASSNERVASAIGNLERSVQANTSVTQETKGTIANLLVAVIQRRNGNS